MRYIGRYEVVDEVRGGAWFQAFRVRDPDTGATRRVERPYGSAMNAQVQARFLSQVRALSKVQHPRIVSVHEVLSEPLAIVLEDPEWGCLEDLLHPGARMPTRRAVVFVRQLLDGLQAVHAAGLVHRNVQPEAVYLRQDGSPVLGGFAAVRQPDHSITGTGEILGSYMYMSPEQRRDPRDVTAAADVYGAACTLFHLLVGRPPPDLSLTFLNAKPLDVLPEGVRGVVQRACAYDPAERLQDAAALSAALHGLEASG